MLVEQIIEFQFWGPGPTGRTCTPIADYFHDKTKISKESLRVDYYVLLKYCRRLCTSLIFTWTKSFTKFYPKMQDFIRVLELNCKKKKDCTS